MATLDGKPPLAQRQILLCEKVFDDRRLAGPAQFRAGPDLIADAKIYALRANSGLR